MKGLVRIILGFVLSFGIGALLYAEAKHESLSISNPTTVAVLIRTETGQQTGLDGYHLANLEEIPNSSCVIEGIDEEEMPEGSLAESNQLILISDPLKGVYTASIFGLRDGPYEISIKARGIKDNDDKPIVIKGDIQIGGKYYFSFSYDSALPTKLKLLPQPSKSSKGKKR